MFNHRIMLILVYRQKLFEVWFGKENILYESEESKGQSKDSLSPAPQNDRFTGSPDEYTYRVI
ncbi:MAG: hypothetical protein WC983_04145 [Tissierellaceae bacterium]